MHTLDNSHCANCHCNANSRNAWLNNRNSIINLNWNWIVCDDAKRVFIIFFYFPSIASTRSLYNKKEPIYTLCVPNKLFKLIIFMACFMRFNKLCITNGFTSYASGVVYALRLFRFLYGVHCRALCSIWVSVYICFVLAIKKWILINYFWNCTYGIWYTEYYIYFPCNNLTTANRAYT